MNPVHIIMMVAVTLVIIFFSSRRRHTRLQGDWSSDVCSSDLGIGVSRGEPGELRAVPEPLDHVLGTGTTAFQLLRGRLLGYPDQDVRDVVFGRSVFSFALLEEQILDLTFADRDLAGDFAVAQSIHQDLVAQLFPKRVETDRIALERLPEFGQ